MRPTFVTKPRQFIAFSVLTTLLLFSASAGPLLARTVEKCHPPKNFGTMEDWLFRGAAPEVSQLRFLKGLGITTIIDLRYTAQRGYETEVRLLGMSYIRIPLRPRSLPTEEELQHFLSLLESEENRPAYVHCREGKHRAGLLLALFRVLRQGAERKEALAEMQTHGFGLGHRKMMNFFLSRTNQGRITSGVGQPSPLHSGSH